MADKHYKILFLADSLNNGGAERQLALLVKYLPSAWQRRIWSLDGGPFEDIISNSGISVQLNRRTWRFDVSPALSLWKILRTWQPDIVHSWGWMATAAAGPFCRMAGIPLIDGTIRMGMVPPYRGRANRWSMKWASLIVANSQAGLQAWHIKADRGRVIYNGFDPDRLALCNSGNIASNGALKVVMTGRMVSEKDYRSFFSAARKLVEDRDIDWRFFAVGDGPLRKELIQGNKDLIDRGVVVFSEPGTEVLPIVRHSHVGILMTNPTIHQEGCSNSIMEYMACGLPVICGESGGNRELVVDGVTGYIIHPGDVQGLVDKLRYLKEYPALALAMGQKGKNKILKEFSIERMIQGYIGIYEECL
jgi:glycosyltransferase involved in cell wall biosynthesis